MSNGEMHAYWNEGAGPVWVAHEERLDAQLAPIGARALDRATPRAGERVLDVGCGCGATTLDLAERVGTDGRVVAVDISRPMLERARARAERAALADRIEFRLEDAQRASLEPAHYDLVFSRFGVMFFDDPVAAFANLRRALRPGGRIAFACWQTRDRNPWMMAPALAAAKHVAFPPPPAPDAPGPFAFGDLDRVRGILDAAGFGAFEADAVNEPLRIGGGSVEDALELMLAVGPVGAALREAKADEAQRARVMQAVREVLETFRTERGLEAPSGWWLVRARNAP